MSFTEDLVKIIIKYDDPATWKIFIEQYGPYEITNTDILYAKNVNSIIMYNYLIHSRSFNSQLKGNVITKSRSKSFCRSLMLKKNITVCTNNVRPRARTLSI
jgi:hypothetical protein